jgi:hypothetical protein
MPHSRARSRLLVAALAVAMAHVARAAPQAEFSIDPPAMRSCDPAKAATLSWDASPTGAGTIKLFVVGEDGTEKLVAHKGARDSAETGPWAKAGTVFVLRDATTTQEVGRASIASSSGRC